MSNQVFVFPTTFAQQQLWLVDQMTPGSTVNNISIAISLQGPLSIPILENTLNEIVRRHESLRTSFATVDGQPMQIVAPELRVRISVEDMRTTSTASNEAIIQERVQEDARRAFDLAASPLFRAILLVFSDSHHALVLTMHHLISDGWSLDIFNRELSVLYHAFSAGKPSPLPELPIQYPDFAIWQRNWLQGETLRRQLGYWKQQLADAPPVLELPTDRPRPPTRSFQGARVFRHLPESLSNAIKALSRHEGTTMFMTLLAGWQILLQRYSHQDDILLGTPVANRTRTETEGMIGLFVNTLVLRTDLSGDPSFCELLRRVRETCVGAFAHQEMPFEKLVEEMTPERHLSHTPLFQVMFVLQNAQTTRKPSRSVSTPTDPTKKLKLKAMPIEAGAAKFDLTLSVIDTKSGLLATLTYSVDLFEEHTAQRMLGHLETLLEAAMADPLQPISLLPMLTVPERTQLLEEWNSTHSPRQSARPIHCWFEEHAERTPEATAVTCEETSLSYGDLNARANQLARCLVTLGVKPDNTVGLCVERSVELMVGLLAILKAGAAYVPLDPAYPKERLAFIIEDAEAGILITQEALLSRLPSTAAHILCIDADWDSIQAQDSSNLPCVAGLENLAYVIYTSGSTGGPKGVMVEHKQLLSYTLGVMERLDIGPGWSYAMVQPLTVDSSITMIYPAFCSGGHLHLITNDRARDSYGLADYFRQNVIDCLKIAPSHLSALHIFPQPELLMPRKRLVIGGEPSHWAWACGLRHLAPGCRVFNHYGPTETTVGVLVFPLNGARSERELIMTPLGRPLPGTKIYILDKHLHPVPVGVQGELYVGGSYVARGYLKLPELTDERFVPDPFTSESLGRLYRTGDMARYLPEGDVEFLGRSDDQIKIRGFRIELREIEAAIVRHREIREAVVLGREDTPGYKRLVAYIVPKVPACPSSTELRSFLADHLPAHMVPTVYLALPELPRTSHGKIDRRALPVPERAQSEQTEAYESPRNRNEEILARIWSQVLRVERVGIHDNFFELGGDSILGIQIISRCNQAGLCFTAKQLFENQTIAKLAPVVGNTVSTHAEQGLISGTAPLTPIQRRFFEQDPLEPNHFNQAFLLEVRRPTNPLVLREAVAALVMHHDALRMRFRSDGRRWSQSHSESTGAEIFSTVDLSHLNPVEQQLSIRKITVEAQRSLEITRGPVARFISFDCGLKKHRRLLVVIHRLVVDGASWRILLEDLETACDQLRRGEAIQLPRKTTSFQHWANRLEAYADSVDLRRELNYWLAEPRNRPALLPRDFPSAPGANTVKSMRTVSIRLSVNQTRALLQDVPRTYRTQINDVLLTAVLQGFARWTGSQSLVISLEGHGREGIFDDCDLSRTIGWFTSAFPIVFDLQDVDDVGGALKSVKEQLRRIPSRGIGYGLLRYVTQDTEIRDRVAGRPSAEVSFNYLGQVDPALSEATLLSPALEKLGATRSSRSRRYHLIEIAAKLLGGRLQIALTYSEQVHRRSTIERLSRYISQSLQAIVNHCQTSGEGWHTASDFPLAKLEPDSFHRLFGGDRNILQIYPLSPLQQGMLFHTLYAPDSDVYIGQRFRTLSQLDVGAFQRAWRRVIARHAVLRASVVWKEVDQPLQIVRRKVDIQWVELDWQHLASAEQAAAFERYLAEDRRSGFDLTRASLMRLALIRLGPSTYKFLWSIHQLLLDGWSTTLILREVAAFYEAFSRGRNLHLKRPRPYEDFIAWLQTQNHAAAETFWRKQLEGVSAPTPLRIDQPRLYLSTEQDQYQGQRVQLPVMMARELEGLARHCRVTLNTLIQAAWAILLSQYSGEPDVIFGAIVSGRPPDLKGVEGMIGLFINTLPVRVRVVPDVSLRAFLQELQSQQVEARAFEYTSLVQIQGWSDIPRGIPLFESTLVFENHPTKTSTRRRCSNEIRQIRPTERTNYSLNLIVMPGEALTLQILYDSARFSVVRITRLLGHLQTILKGMCGNAEQLVGSLPLLTTAERRQMIVDWNATGRSWPLDSPIHIWFEEQVDRTPGAVAISCGAEFVTFSELNGRANRLARHLQGLGVRDEQLVAVCLDRSVDAIVALLAVLKAGAAYVPLDPGYPAERLAFMLEDSCAVVLITRASLSTILPITSVPIVFMDSASAAIRKRSPKNLAPTRGGERLAYVIYTSGSTGRPKGVLGTHAGAVNRAIWMWEAYPFDSDEVCCQKTALSFVDSIWEIFGPLLKGIPLVIIPDEVVMDPHALIRSLEQHSVSRIVLVPSLLRAILDSNFELPRRLATLRIVVSSGESLSRELVRRFQATLPKSILLNLYGSSEVSADVTYYDAGTDSHESGAVSIGRPIANMRTYILDQSLRPVPIGVPGELYVAGVGVSRGYLGRPDLTAEKYIQNPFSRKPGEVLFRTGDLARYSEDGVIEYLGRRDRQIKIRGFRVELDEIEAVLAQHSDVHSVLIIDREVRPGDRQIVGYVVPKSGIQISMTELRDFLQKRLPDYMVPSELIHLDQVPLTPNGKIDRRALPSGGSSSGRADRVVEYVAPRTSTEEIVAVLWSQILGVDKVGAYDSFLALGGHSLLAMQLVSRIRDAFQVELPLRVVFQDPTVGGLADAVERLKGRVGEHEPQTIVPVLREQFGVNMHALALEVNRGGVNLVSPGD